MSVDRSSPTWLAISAQVQDRIDELKEQCVGLNATDATRAACAARIDELRALLGRNVVMPAQSSAYRSESY